MYYVYVLLSLKNKRFYVGCTEDLKKRVGEHNKGIGSTFTKHNRPYKLIFYEAFLDKKDATKQELFYKSGYGREVLKEKIKNSVDEIKIMRE